MFIGVLAHMVESSPFPLMNYFSNEFLKSTIEISISSSFEVKKSSVFFLATIIKYTKSENVVNLINNETLDLLSEMLSCSGENMAVRYLDAFIRICQIFNSSSDINAISSINDSYLSDVLESLFSHESYVVVDMVNSLQSLIDGSSVPVML
jgi:hypothetical protein